MQRLPTKGFYKQPAHYNLQYRNSTQLLQYSFMAVTTTIALYHRELAEPKKRNKSFLIILILLILAGGVFGINKYISTQCIMKTTDDAQITANISPVIPRVSGYVMDVRVGDNQPVKKGDTLIADG